MIEISLLPVDEEDEAKTAQRGLGFTIPRFIPRGFGIAVVVLLAMYVLSHLRASSLSRALTDGQQTLSDLKKDSLLAQTIEANLPTLRDKANIFRDRLEKRKLWSQMLKEIILSCPGEIQLTEIKLSPVRAGVTTKQVKELVISGSYTTGGNLEMIFKDKLQRSKAIADHYHIFIAMTQPQVDRTDFWIHCREQ